MASSPLARYGLTANSYFLSSFPPQLMFPVIGGKDVVVWEEKPQKSETDLSALLFQAGILVVIKGADEIVLNHLGHLVEGNGRGGITKLPPRNRSILEPSKGEG